MKTEPQGYWTRVFDQAASLLKARPELNGDSAYWLARRMVDQALIQKAEADVPGLFRFEADAVPELTLTP
jgi:hypothetical protein